MIPFLLGIGGLSSRLRLDDQGKGLFQSEGVPWQHRIRDVGLKSFHLGTRPPVEPGSLLMSCLLCSDQLPREKRVLDFSEVVCSYHLLGRSNLAGLAGAQ